MQVDTMVINQLTEKDPFKTQQWLSCGERWREEIMHVLTAGHGYREVGGVLPTSSF